MTKMILIEPSLQQSDRRSLTIETGVWDAMCELGRKQGYVVANVTTIGSIDAGLFASAVRRGMKQGRPARGGRGSDRFTMGESSILKGDVLKTVQTVLSLLEAGGVVVTKRTW